MLEGVTTDENGTALEAQVKGYEIAGKTGTAQVPDNHGGYIPDDWNATFVGFVPAHLIASHRRGALRPVNRRTRAPRRCVGMLSPR